MITNTRVWTLNRNCIDFKYKVFDLVHVFNVNFTFHFYNQSEVNSEHKTIKSVYFDLFHVFKDDLTSHFYNQSRMNSEDNTK